MQSQEISYLCNWHPELTHNYDYSLNTNRTNLTNLYSCHSCYSCSYNYTWIRDKIRNLLFKYWEEIIQIYFYAELISQKNASLLPSPYIPFLTEESLFCHQREPLFFKRRKSDIFCSKKFAMSLIRAIFAFGNGREMKLQSCELLR